MSDANGGSNSAAIAKVTAAAAAFLAAGLDLFETNPQPPTADERPAPRIQRIRLDDDGEA